MSLPASFLHWRQQPARYRLPVLLAASLLAGGTAGALSCQPQLADIAAAETERERAEERLQTALRESRRLALLAASAPHDILATAARQHGLAIRSDTQQTGATRDGMQEIITRLTLDGTHQQQMDFLRTLDRQPWSAPRLLVLQRDRMTLETRWFVRPAS